VEVTLAALYLEKIGKPLPNRSSFSCKRSKYEAISEQNELARRPASVTALTQQVPCSNDRDKYRKDLMI
jgi:hypothetical protein